MKRIFLIITVMMLVLSGCAKTSISHKEKTVVDPGPPYGCQFDRIEDYYKLSDALGDPEVDVVALLAEISGYESISDRENIEMVCKWIDRVPYPVLEGYDFYQLQIEYRDGAELSGNVVYYLGEEDNLIILEFYPLSAEESTDGEMKIQIKDSGNHPDNKMIRYFSAEVGGVSLRIVMRAETDEQAIETLASMEFKRVSELRQEDKQAKQQIFDVEEISTPTESELLDSKTSGDAPPAEEFETAEEAAEHMIAVKAAGVEETVAPNHVGLYDKEHIYALKESPLPEHKQICVMITLTGTSILYGTDDLWDGTTFFWHQGYENDEKIDNLTERYSLERYKDTKFFFGTSTSDICILWWEHGDQFEFTYPAEIGVAPEDVIEHLDVEKFDV